MFSSLSWTWKGRSFFSVSSPIGGVHIKTVKKLNEFSPNCPDLSPGDLLGESSKASKLQFTCVSCSLMFTSVSQLRRHTKNAHEKEETLFFQVCTKICHGKDILKLYMCKT